MWRMAHQCQSSHRAALPTGRYRNSFKTSPRCLPWLHRSRVGSLTRREINLYVDIHQNGRQRNIEVATLGISQEEAQLIKGNYRQIRDQVLKLMPGAASVDLLVEP